MRATRERSHGQASPGPLFTRLGTNAGYVPGVARRRPARPAADGATGRDRAVSARPAAGGDPSTEILAAASALFGEHGRRRARRCRRSPSAVGLQQSSLYYYFRSKEEVLAAIVARGERGAARADRRVARRRRLARRCSCYRFVPGDVVALCALPFDINEIHRLAARDRERFAGTGRSGARLRTQLAGDRARGRRRPASSATVDPRLTALTIMSNDEGVQNWYRRGRAAAAQIGAAGRRVARSWPTSTVGGLLRGRRVASSAVRGTPTRSTPRAAVATRRPARLSKVASKRRGVFSDRKPSTKQPAPYGRARPPASGPVARGHCEADRTRVGRVASPRRSPRCRRLAADAPAAAPGATRTAADAERSDPARSATARGRAGSRSRSPSSRASSRRPGSTSSSTYFADYIVVARRAGGRAARRQRADAQRHDLRGRRRRPSRRSSSSTTTRPATTPIICDKSITSIADLKGKTIAAEAGVVDHFLLLQGLATEGMTQDDIDFHGVQDRRGRGGVRRRRSSTASAVFAPFTLQALKRPGSHVLFSSTDFPGAIPDHLVATADAATRTPGGACRSSSTPGTRPSTTSRPTPTRRRRSWPTRRRVSTPRSTRSSPRARRSSPPTQALDAFERPGRRPDLAARDGPADQPVPGGVRA